MTISPQLKDHPASTQGKAQFGGNGAEPAQDNITLVSDGNETKAMQLSTKPLLQRRSSAFATIQAALDGLLVIGLTYGLALAQFGRLPTLYLIFCIVLLATMGVVYDRLGIYRHNGNFTQKALVLLKAWTITFGILLGIAFLSKTSALFSRQFLSLFFISGILGQTLVHIAIRYINCRIKSEQDKTNALLIGTGQLAHYLFQRINQNPWIPEKIVGTIDNRFRVDRRKNVREQGEYSDLPILGGLSDVLNLVDQHDIRTVYFAIRLDSSPIIEELYFSLLDKNVDIHWAPNIFALNLVNHSVKELAGIPIITLSETPMSGVNLVLKTIEDKVLSLLALLLVSPVLAAAALAIKLDSPGPVFFKQDRTGWNGKNFKIWKFRTMRVHKPELGVIKQATKNDPRITRIGKFLRRTSIDELPQLINVLQGTMSLVGPRPHPVSFDALYSKRIEAYLARHKIKPGISGLAQVRGYRGETSELDKMAKRVESDLEYINNWSIWLDFSILFRTAMALFSKNAY